ncbi:MAG TPA: acylphosphatase, partial [Blastocatellia bacterium]|nr:acylphosphatase [Blastocatellia bacterium]
MSARVQILVRGIVQGVGFRPFVFSQASRRSLKGRVLNNTSGVLIDVEGEAAAIEQFVEEIKWNPPPRSLVEAVECTTHLPPANYETFRIVESDRTGQAFVSISADIGTCQDCLRELFDPEDRRYRYPFINCTNCGPRFTIVEGVPYDRDKTTMREFTMCAACREEYENPLDRRFHAEPIACHQCGPRLSLLDSTGNALTLDREAGDPVSRARALLMAGKIIAVKGIGGFHLACNALDAAAVSELRQRKYREDKPFAIMAASVDEINEYSKVS